MRFVLIALATVLASAAGSCGGDTTSTVRVSQAAIDAIQEYAFISDVTVQSDDGDLHVTYEGGSDGFLRSAGSFVGEGDLLKTFDMPPEAEVVWIEGEGWLRPAGADWQTPADCVVELLGRRDACLAVGLDLLNFFATPSFFIHQFRFDDPVLPAHDRATIQKVQAMQVILDRDDIVQFVLQIEGENLPGQEPSEINEQNRLLIQENARNALPDDFAVEAWIAEEEGYPVRLVVDFTVTSGDEGLLVGTFPPGARVHLQMDITDPNADVQIEAPVVPTP